MENIGGCSQNRRVNHAAIIMRIICRIDEKFYITGRKGKQGISDMNLIVFSGEVSIRMNQFSIDIDLACRKNLRKF